VHVSLEEAAKRRPPGRVPEAALYPVIADSFARRGFSCWREASFFGNWIDLYMRDETNDAIAIEAKVYDWRRALRQAILLRNSAPRVFVALWEPYVHRASVVEFEAAGVGLLSVNGNCEVRLEAPRRVPRYPDAVQIVPGTKIR
jgi:hypothetical protein